MPRRASEGHRQTSMTRNRQVTRAESPPRNQPMGAWIRRPDRLAGSAGRELAVRERFGRDEPAQRARAGADLPRNVDPGDGALLERDRSSDQLGGELGEVRIVADQ